MNRAGSHFRHFSVYTFHFALPILLVLGLFCTASAQAQPAKKKKKTLHPTTASAKPPKLFSGNSIPPTKAEIIKQLEPPATAYQENIFGRLISKLSVETANGPLITLPIMESSKDTGADYGIMPIMAIRNKKNQTVKAVIAPSLDYNRNLGATFTWRYYMFPNDKRLIVMRAALSQHVEKDFLFTYYAPDFYNNRLRLHAEARDWITGKPSFYGIGPNSSKSSKANYALHQRGEEIGLETLLIKNLYVDLTHSFYTQSISRGPLKGVPQLADTFPSYFTQAAEDNDFLVHRLSLIYDDTDHPFLPKIGTYASLSGAFSSKAFMSDYSYSLYTAEIKQYYNYKEEGRFVTAVHYLLQEQKGDTLPFYAMPQLGESTGLRMAGDGRFTDRGRLVMNIEERITLSRSPFMKFVSEVEISPFLDVGTVFPGLSKMRFKNLKWGPGVATRLLIRPQVVATMDFAFGSEGTNAIIKVGYPF
ncbi:MAG: BamA/TamA family outer membrane protein [Elusimicrobia bacterium]|nr:BamA/TamA family outer membrane protein [Elusimicrobiota bacterium]